MTSSNSLFVDLSGDQFLRLIFTHFQGFIRSSIQGVIEDSSHQNGNIFSAFVPVWKIKVYWCPCYAKFDSMSWLKTSYNEINDCLRKSDSNYF